MTMQEGEQGCGSCAYATKDVYYPTPAGLMAEPPPPEVYFQCRRFPPNARHGFRRMNETDWCGEWKPLGQAGI